MLIHVGYPKTGTTFLQKNVFSNPEIFHCPWGARSAVAIDLFATTYQFEFDYDQARSIIRPGLEYAKSNDLILLLSEETLVGDIARGVYWGKQVADNIAISFPNAKILLTLREQRSILVSAYKEYILGGGYFTAERFIGATGKKAGFSGICRLHELEYDKAVSYYMKLFGSTNVKVLFFEDLINNPQFFFESLYAFIDKEYTNEISQTKAEHIGHRGLTVSFRKLINMYTPHPDWMNERLSFTYKLTNRLTRILDKMVPNGLHVRQERKLKGSLTSLVGDDYYAASNRKLMSLLDLTTLPAGYQC